MKTRLVFLLTVVFLCAAPTVAQTAYSKPAYEFGGPKDLKGLKSVYISPEVDAKDRERMVKIIQKELPDVKIVDDADDSEIVLIFGGESETVITGATWNAYGGSIVRVPLEAGTGKVFVNGKEKPRLVLTVSNSQQSRAEKRPVTKFTQAFVKAWKEANGIK